MTIYILEKGKIMDLLLESVIETKKEQNKTLKNILTRIFDISFSLFAILFFLPLMSIIAILIKIKSPDGPIIFKQKRLTLNSREFFVYKFRTMVPNAEEKLEHLLKNDKDIREEYLKYRKLKNDIRIVGGIGIFLRRTSLDELPQFFNVLFGDMSIVGPRPYMRAEFNGYSQSIVDLITSVKPGITGYWQVIPTRHGTTFDERVKVDIDYIYNRSLFLDLKIIFRTIEVMVLKKGM